jgi:hypothetical protein
MRLARIPKINRISPGITIVPLLDVAYIYEKPMTRTRHIMGWNLVF